MIAKYGTFEFLLAAHYRFEDELGRGAMGTVYRAKDVRLGRPVAIKMLHPMLTNELGVARFQSEIRIAAGLHHPNIIGVHDCGEADGRLYYVMDYLGGETLRECLEREKQLAVVHAIGIVEQVAAGLQYAHDHGVVHRDVKPENIILAEGRACVMDFGLARALGDMDTQRLTASGISVGTPHYLSPEQASAEKEVGPKADQYALGCVLYEMLVGEPPFTGPTATSIAMRHVSEEPRPLRVRRKSASLGVEAAVMRALEKVPADRFGSVREFAASLKNEVAVVAEAPTRRRIRRPRKRRVIVSSLLAIMAAFTVMFALGQSKRDGALGGLGRRIAGILPRDVSLDSNQVAVAPFAIAGTDTVWREGLVDLIYPNFDGAGPLRALTTREVLRFWQGGSDAASASALGRTTNSGLVVFGRLAGVGKDSLRLYATLWNVARNEAIGEVDLTEQISHVDRLADSASVRLLRELGASRPIGAVRTAFIGSRSMPALKAFLRGEQMYRRNRFAEAENLYQQAIRDDEYFPLALHRLRSVMRGTRTENDTLSFRYALRAGALNRGLPPRDSLLITADSLYAATALDSSGPQWPAMLRRRLDLLMQAADAYPRDPEVLAELGEAQFHQRAYYGVELRDCWRSFTRAIRIDPAYGPAYFHAIELGSRYATPDELRRTVTSYLALNPTDVPMRVLENLLDPTRTGSIAKRGATDTVNALQLIVAAYLVRLRPDAEELAVQLTRSMDVGGHYRALSPAESLRVERWRFRIMNLRGHFREAYARAGALAASEAPDDYVQLALLGVVSVPIARTMFLSWLDTADVSRARLALPFWAEIADTTPILQLRRKSERKGDGAARRAYAHAAADAYLWLARRDTIRATLAFSRIPAANCHTECTFDRISYARLLLATNEPERANALLARFPPAADLSSTLDIVWSVERARAALTTGDAATARDLFAYAARMWQNADAGGKRYLAEATSHAGSSPAVIGP